ncbi:ABC transporter substrate-binding protein [Chelatococcus asaccharovorans]|uniref:ABC transporter substrate-binding protein n=1 Tax=Chelatococcus asaccharovorans TaxID=28210 RepID=UPI00224C67DF|nr:ABC transporter substrate-binding protein [Chelatococcus asaccharovorans]CAH1654820.1 putative spermidine/putrescine transport system substrate-binding protein [Chelatococcus asaccharovorans]CAH1685631.1 putative spermidine/putrescine transport system substrate-binding protein [Chelatococcus asaccharovorans]
MTKSDFGGVFSPEQAAPTTAGKVSRRSFLATAAAGAALSMPAVRRAAAADEKVLYVNTWGGAWEEAAKEALFTPFTRDTGIEIRTVAPVSFAKLAAQVRTGVYEFDVTTLGVAELGRANQAKLIAAPDKAILDPAKLWPGAVVLDGVASHAFGNVLAYRNEKFPAPGLQSWADFWDVQKFPGSRCLQRYAGRVIPIALLADGVAPDKLFPLDLDRAFKALDRIKPHIRVWWSQGPQSQQLLRDGEVDAIGMWNTQVQRLVEAKAPITVSWNQAVVDVAYWAVARGTPRSENAWRFVNYAVQPEPLAQFAVKNDYGPMNPEAFKYIPEDKAKQLPTWPANFKNSIVLDPAKMLPQIDEFSKRFDQWIAS